MIHISDNVIQTPIIPTKNMEVSLNPCVSIYLSPVKRGDIGFSFSVCPASCPGHISESTQWNF